MRGCWVLLLTLGIAGAWAVAGAARDAQADALPAVTLTDAAGRSRTLAELVADTRSAQTLVVRVQAEWCGTCRWHASATADLTQRRDSAIRVMDMLIADENNAPADAAALVRWQQRVPFDVAVMTGSATALRPLLPAFAPLPWVLVIDTSTHAVRAAFADPALGLVTEVLEASAAGAAERTRQAVHVAPRDAGVHEGRFTAEQWDLIRGMRLPASPPPDPGNRVADDPAAAAFGEALFRETRLSPANRACASCHAEDLLFTNGKDVASEGVGPGTRNVPTILLAAHARSFLWDGRADSLWTQAVMPFEDPTEMGSSRLFVAHAIGAYYRAEYARVFGPLPALGDRTRFPASGQPGDASWQAMAAADRTAVSTVLANVAKAIAAFERRLVVAPNALDRYADGDTEALTAEQKDGLRAFLAAGCAQCHYGPMLSDGAFHNLRFPTGRPDRVADEGRAHGLPFLSSHEFSAFGVFSDAPRARPERRATPAAEGAFRTPGLRGVALTMPYGHGGGFGGLRSVIDAHRTGGLPPGSPFAIGAAEPWAQGFDTATIPAIQAFLLTLRADRQQ